LRARQCASIAATASSVAKHAAHATAPEGRNGDEQAIRDLADASAAVAASAAPVATEPTRHDDAERRQLTIMFTDLVGSTALSTKLDPQDMRFLIGAYHKCVAETVALFDGFVANYMGDGVLIYFGDPQAHEDDAERAVRAGLALIETVRRLQGQEPLQVRIGIATGLVVVGDIVGPGEAQERGVVGETPNLVARLQGGRPCSRWAQISRTGVPFPATLR
jgi:class 3 adenylate cyclase